MASKKNRNRPRPPGAARPAPKPPAAPKPATAKQGRDRTGPTRAERLAAAEAARRRKAARKRAVVVGGTLAVLALLVVTISNSRRSNDQVVTKLQASGACKYDTKADSDAGAGNNHVTGDVVYKVDPPAGGNHNPEPAAAGIYTVETAPPDTKVVHALEHGYVAIWYRPDLDPKSVDDLRAVANRYDRDVLLVPRDSLPENRPVAATAWHRRLLCSESDTAPLEQFVTAYRNKGPEKIPH